MRISKEQHTRHPWKVHSLAADFELEDVWQFPIRAAADQGLSLAIVREKVLEPAMKSLSKKGLAGRLFQLRFALGRLFGWDRQVSKPSGNPGQWESLRARYVREYEANTGTDSPESLEAGPSFTTVYDLPDERLAEISNRTVHGLLHLGWVPLDDTHYTVQLAVCVKKRGWFGALYMKLIKPFRIWIVYPSMMRAVSREWRRFEEEMAL